MPVCSGINCITKALCITFIVCAQASLADLCFAGDVTGGRSTLAFTANQDGEYEFDTGILRGTLRDAGQTARARLRLVVIEAVSNREILNLYEKYMKDLSEIKVQTDNP